MYLIFRKSSKSTALPSLCTHPQGLQPQLFCAGNHGFLPLSADHTGQRRLGGQQVRLLDGLSLSVSRLLQYSLHCRHHRPHCEVPPLLPHPSSLCLPHPQVLAPNSTLSLLGSPQFLGFFSRGFARALSGDQHSDPEPDGDVGNNGVGDYDGALVNSGADTEEESRGFSRVLQGETDSDPETDGDENVGGDFDEVNVNSGADPEEVSRVCRVIDESFALDRNMEAVLDECNVDLSHALVVGVLERCKHARKPAFRFFCWAGQKAGFTHDSRTYNAMMSVLGRTRQFESMMGMLGEMGEKGLLTMEAFSVAIKAFAAAKERKKAVGVFELMKRYDFDAGVDTINCLLDNLGRAKLGKEAQALFEKLEDRFTPNLRTYTVLLNGWCRIKNLVEAGRTWNEMIDKGFKPDIIAHHTMLEGLLKCKKKSDAIKLFEVMKAKGPSPNVRTYTILIRDLCKQMKMKEAVEYFDEMVDSGCQPDAAVYTCLIMGFGNQKKMDNVYALLKEMKEKGCPADGRTYNALIKLMTNRQMPDDAVRIYKKMIQNGIQPTLHTFCKTLPKPLHPPSQFTPPTASPNLIPSTPIPTLSLANTSHHQLHQFLKAHLTPSFTPHDLLIFLKNKLHYHPKFAHFDLHIFTWAATIDSFRHDHSTYEWMVKTLAITDRFDDLHSLLQGMVCNPCPCSDGIFSCPRSEPIFRFALNAFCRVGRLEDAEISFESMRRMIDGKPSVAMYNILINGYVNCREHEKAMTVYEKMIKDRVKPDAFTFNSLINSCCRNSQFGLALEMFKEMKDKGCSPNVVSFNTLIKGSFRKRKFEEGIGMAYEMLELGCEFSNVTCEILVDGLCREGRVLEACDLLIDFSGKGALPNGFDYFCLIEALCGEENVDRALELLDQLWRKGNAPSLIACTTLIEGLRRFRKTEEAFQLMEKMLREGILPDSVTCNCLLQDLCEVGRSFEANELRLLASSKGLDSDGMTFNILVKGYSREGKRKEGKRLLNEMLDLGFIPDLASYNRLMNGLSNGGSSHQHK